VTQLMSQSNLTGAKMALTVGMVALLLTLAPQLTAQQYQYDEGGRLRRVVYAEGGGVAYEYDVQDNITAIIPLDMPAAPTRLDVTRLSDTETHLIWSPVDGADGYIIERRRVGSTVWEGVATVSPDTTRFVDAALKSEMDYVYRIAASGADGSSAFRLSRAWAPWR